MTHLHSLLLGGEFLFAMLTKFQVCFSRGFLQWNHWWCLFTSPSWITQNTNRSEQWHCVSWKRFLACVQADREGGIDRWILYFLSLSLSNAVQEAALFWSHGLHVDWESETWDIPGSGERENTHPRGREGKQPSNISSEKETRWVFPELAESNPLGKRNF